MAPKKKKEITRTFRKIKEKDGTERLEPTGTISPAEPTIVPSTEGSTPLLPNIESIPEQKPFNY